MIKNVKLGQLGMTCTAPQTYIDVVPPSAALHERSP